MRDPTPVLKKALIIGGLVVLGIAIIIAIASSL